MCACLCVVLTGDASTWDKDTPMAEVLHVEVSFSLGHSAGSRFRLAAGLPPLLSFFPVALPSLRTCRPLHLAGGKSVRQSH